MNTIYYGEIDCQAIYKSGAKKGQQCVNKAYYRTNEDKYLCGVHCKKCNGVNNSIMLPKNPDHEQLKLNGYEELKGLAKNMAQNNYNSGIKGDVICTKMLMMKNPFNKPGYLMIFPNFKHKNRKDGIGLPSLSPKSIGPINHKMPNLPPAKNLENYHQFAKVFSCEVDEDGNPDKNYIRRRIEGYQDDIPHRHKFPREQINSINSSNNINIPLYSIYYDFNGNEHRYNYIQSRYFYCHWYEKLVSKSSDFNKLKKYIEEGYNLQIVGYDAYHITKSLYEHYLDDSIPFGHELVLYTMLTIKREEEYPWNQYYDKYEEIYKDVI